MPLLSPVWVLAACILVTAAAAAAQWVILARLEARLLTKAGRDASLYFREADGQLTERLAAAMSRADLPVGAAAVRVRHVIFESEPSTDGDERRGVCRLDFVVGSVRLRSNRSRVVAFGIADGTATITHVADEHQGLAEQFEEALASLEAPPAPSPEPPAAG